MSNPAGRIGTAIRDRVPPLTSIPLPTRVDQRLLEKRWPMTELATPPVGSGLHPVLGDAGAPLIGHTFEFMHFGPDFNLRRQQYFGPVSWVSAFGRRIVVLSGPDAAQAALVNKDIELLFRVFMMMSKRLTGKRLRRLPSILIMLPMNRCLQLKQMEERKRFLPWKEIGLGPRLKLMGFLGVTVDLVLKR